jgi:hypothetical protein
MSARSRSKFSTVCAHTTSPMNQVWSPVSNVWTFRHSRFTMHSSMIGESILFPGTGVSPVSSNLSTSLPDRSPQKITSSTSSFPGILTLKSGERCSSSWLKRDGMTPIPMSGGLNEKTCTNAKVIMFFSSLPTTARTTGKAGKVLIPRTGFISVLTVMLLCQG